MIEKNSISIGFSGDLSFSGYYAKRYHDDLFSNEIKAFFENNDANIINYESPITPCRVTDKDYLAHRSDPEVLAFVKKYIKSPILSFANNHMMDYGDIGVVDTIEYTKAADIPVLGIGLDLERACQTIELGNNVKVGVFSFQYKNNKVASLYHGGPLHESSIKEIVKMIDRMKEKCDYVVAVYHGGDEFVFTPLPYTRCFLKKILRLGVDVVVAHHPHVVQGYEYVGNKMIFYSLGNFLFDTDYQRIQEKTDDGALLRLIFSKEGVYYEMLPTHIERSTGKIVVGKSNPNFRNIREINYFKEWCRACLHMKTVRQRKKVLRVKSGNMSKGKRLNPIKKFLHFLKNGVKVIILDQSSLQKKMVQVFGAWIAKYVFHMKE